MLSVWQDRFHNCKGLSPNDLENIPVLRVGSGCGPKTAIPKYPCTVADVGHGPNRKGNSPSRNCRSGNSTAAPASKQLQHWQPRGEQWDDSLTPDGHTVHSYVWKLVETLIQPVRVLSLCTNGEWRRSKESAFSRSEMTKLVL